MLAAAQPRQTPGVSSARPDTGESYFNSSKSGIVNCGTFMPVREMRNGESEKDSFRIPILVPITDKLLKTAEESESQFFKSQN